MRPNRLIEGKRGPMLILANDTILCPIIEKYGAFAEHEIEQLEQFLVPGDTVIDAGANIGALTVPMARRVGPSGRVFAFEPQRLVFQVLTANVALNSLSNVETVHAACGERGGWIDVPAFDGRDHSVGSLSLAGQPSGEPVRLVAIDDYALGAVRLIKADVEGMEIDVLRGARRTIARCRPILYLENEQSEKSAALIKEAEGMGYRLWWHFPPLDPTFVRRSVNMIGLPLEVAAEMDGYEPVTGASDLGWQGLTRELARQGIHAARVA